MSAESGSFATVSGSGQPLLLIHGFPFDRTMWQTQIEPLSSSCQVIAPDLRGFGASASTDVDSASGIEMKTYAEDLAVLLDQLDVVEPVILCGFSMGGYILWQFLQRYPQRVKGMVLCDTRAIADSDDAAESREQMAAKVLREGVEPLVEGMLPKLLASRTHAECPELVEQVASMIRAAEPAAVAAALRGMARRPDVRDKLENFHWPALVMAGAEDSISAPEEMRAVANDLPRASFVEIDDAGHMSPLENPDAFNRALQQFVASL